MPSDIEIAQATEMDPISEVAASLGISIRKHQMLAFAISGALAGLFGSLEAYHSYAIDPRQFGFHLLFNRCFKRF